MQPIKTTEKNLTAKTPAVKKSTKEKVTVKVSSLKAEFLTALKPMKKSLILKIQTILILNKKVVWLKKNKAKCFKAKRFRLKSPTAMGLI